jgi:diguanylate cyclase (GGDEF)-like protein
MNETSTTSQRREWLSHQLSEFLASVSAYPNELAAFDGGVGRLAEAVEAEVAAVIVDGEVVAVVGFRPGRVPGAELRSIAIGSSAITLDPLGELFAFAVDLEDDERAARLVLLRVDAAFSQEELILVRGMARVLALTVRLLRVVERERGVANSLQERQELLERLFRIQRSISHRAPITSVLSAITEGAASLLDADIVTLRLIDEDDPTMLRIVATVGLDAADVAHMDRRPIGQGMSGRAVFEDRVIVAADYGSSADAMPMLVDRGVQSAMAAPVHRDGKVAGSLLVASAAPDMHYSGTQREMLLAFAEHTSLALNDSSAVDAINRAYADAMHRATHDALTGLPNRALALDRLGHALERMSRQLPYDEHTVCVLFVDLDRFKSINDSLGHSVGDDVLKTIARRLKLVVRPSDTVARLSGDEFVVVCEEIVPDEAMRVAERVGATIAEPMTINEREIILTASVGVAFSRGPSGKPEDVLRDADVAMYRAKERGGALIEVFDEAIRAEMVARIELEHQLRAAIAQGHLQLEYQPVVTASGRDIVALEALVRWDDPDHGMRYPDTFIPLAEQSGLIVPLGHWVIEEACRQIAEWRGAGSTLGLVRVDVNLSARQFTDTRLLSVLCDSLARHGLSGTDLGIEITESVLMEDAESTTGTLGALKALGLHLAIDDFGTGYSSLGYLQSFPVDAVKVDRSFIKSMSEGGNDAIVSAVVSLAGALGLEVIAEGVETTAQLTHLLHLGCELVQGFLFGPPASPGLLEERHGCGPLHAQAL